jgi:hypothetical protein
MLVAGDRSVVLVVGDRSVVLVVGDGSVVLVVEPDVARVWPGAHPILMRQIIPRPARTVPPRLDQYTGRALFSGTLRIGSSISTTHEAEMKLSNAESRVIQSPKPAHL